jgi:tetratricopeptide (TPR) repeat protein
MTRLIILNLILILLTSCSGKDKKEVYNPKAIELNNKAVLQMQKFNNDSALILFDKAIELDKTYYLPNSSKAAIFILRKEYDKALVESEEAIKIKPDFAEGWTFAGMIHDKLGNTETAMEYYKKSVELFDKKIADPVMKTKVFTNRLNRAFSLILLGQESEAKDEMKKLKEEKPDDKTIDEILKLSKQDYMNQMFKNE